MSKLSKNLWMPLGGAAAAVLSAAASMRAQSASPGVPRRDSMVTERIILLPGRMDSINVIASKIIRERSGSAVWIALTSQFDSLVANSVDKRLVMRGGMVAPFAMRMRSLPVAKGWLGLNTQGPTLIISDSSGTRYRFFAYQPIISIDPGSPADRAGVEPGDLLVAYNGVDLIGHDFNLNGIVAPKKRVDVTVRRDGETKDFTIVAAAVPEEVARRRAEMDRATSVEFSGQGALIVGDNDPPFAIGADRPMPVGPVGGFKGVAPAAGGTRGAMVVQGGFGPTLRSTAIPMSFFSPNGLFGANLVSVSDELARVLKLRRGVLVTEVPEDTPAYRAGLRTGDVIVTAEKDSVTTVGGLRKVVFSHAAEHSTDLQVIRQEKGQQKVRQVTVTWPDSPN